MVIDIDTYTMEDDIEETNVYEYTDLTLDERVGILTWYFTNRTINGKAYEWIIGEEIDKEAMDEMSSVALIETMREWNGEVRFVKDLNRKEPNLQAKACLVLSKYSDKTYLLSIEYHEGGIITIEDSLELYEGSKALNDTLDVYASMPVSTRNGDYIWRR